MKRKTFLNLASVCCSTYEVATACATALQADKLLCLLNGPVCDENGRLIRFMTVDEADRLLRKRARQSYSADDYVKAVAGPGYVQGLGLETKGNGSLHDESDSSTFEATKDITTMGHELLDSYISGGVYKLDGQAESGSTTQQGFAIGGHERLNRTHAYLSELTAAVYVCRVSSNPHLTHGDYG
jgi:amino-acid N-acetyltransferase